jgi:hypothetical protein
MVVAATRLSPDTVESVQAGILLSARHPLGSWSDRSAQPHPHHRLGPRRLGCVRSPLRAWLCRGRGRSRARGAVRPGRRDRRGCCFGRVGPMGRARERRDTARRTRSAHASLQCPPAPNLYASARSGAARRRVGRSDRRNGGCSGAGPVARGDARAAAVRARRLGAHALPRGSRVRVELSRHAAARRIAPVRVCGRAARGTRAVDAAHDREWLRADRADRPR